MSPARVRLGVCLVLLCATLRAIMQDEQTLKLRAEARLVEVVVTVRDAQGKPIKGLRKSDFTLLDNNKPRQFPIFTANDFDSPTAPATPVEPPKSTPVPALPPNTFTNTRIAAPPKDTHSTIILLDAMNGWFDSFGWGARGVQGLLTKAPADEQFSLYAISHFTGLELVHDYTTDRDKLMHAVSTYIPKGMHPAPPGFDPPDGHGLVDPYNSGLPVKTQGIAHTGEIYGHREKILQLEANHELTLSSEAVRLSLQALADKLRTLPGRKSVFWVTEGFPPRQLRDMNAPAWNKTISALNDANIEVNAVDADGWGGPSRYWGPGGIISMQQVAEQTGGRAFFHTNDLAGAMAGGIADDRSSYTLAFYLSEVDNKYHDLKLKVDRPGVQLNYRQGYFARSEADADLDARKSDLVNVLTSPVNATGVGITATIDLKPATLDAHVKLDPDALTVTRVKNRWNSKVEEVFLELNAEGGELAKFSMEQPFSITDAQKPGFDEHGASLTQTIPLIPGAAKLQIAVRDSASGRTGSISIDLTQVTPH